MRTFIVIAILLLSRVSQAQCPPTEAQWIEAGKQEAINRISIFKKELDIAIKSLNEESSPNARDRIGKAIRESRERRVIALKNEIWTTPKWTLPLLTELKVGRIGRIAEGYFQNRGRSKLLTREEYEQFPTDVKRAINEEGFELLIQKNISSVMQVIDKDTSLVKIGGQIAYLKGMPTVGLIDNSQLPDEIFVVTGTRQYTTAIGTTNTVMQLEMIAKNDLEKLNSCVTDDIRHPTEFRQWSDLSGKFSVEAALVSFEKNTALLKKKDGSEIKLPLTKLAVDDRKYVLENLGIEPLAKRKTR